MKQEQQYSERLRRLMGLKPIKPVNLQSKKLTVIQPEKLIDNPFDNPFNDDEMNIINVDMNIYINECAKIKDKYKSVREINNIFEKCRIESKRK